MPRTQKEIEYIKDSAGKEFILANSIATDNNESLETVLKNHENAINVRKAYINSGTMVVQQTSNASAMHSWDNIRQAFHDEFGFWPENNMNLGVVLVNGDDAANQTHIEGATWAGGGPNLMLYAVFDRNMNAAIRINYQYIYFH